MTDTQLTPATQSHGLASGSTSGPGAKRVTVWLIRAISYLVYAYVMLVEIILLIGFLLLLLGANPTSSFVTWSYRNLESAMEPFRGIFSSIELGLNDNDVPAVFESSVLFAMVVYAIVAIALNSLIDWLSSRLGSIDRQVRADRAREDALIRAQALRDRATIIEAQRLAEASARAAAPDPTAAPTEAPGGSSEMPPPQR